VVESVRTHSDGVGERQRDGERQSFWNGNDQDGDADDKRADVILYVRVAPRQSFNGKLLDRETHSQSEKCQYSYRCS